MTVFVRQWCAARDPRTLAFAALTAALSNGWTRSLTTFSSRRPPPDQREHRVVE